MVCLLICDLQENFGTVICIGRIIHKIPIESYVAHLAALASKIC